MINNNSKYIFKIYNFFSFQEYFIDKTINFRTAGSTDLLANKSDGMGVLTRNFSECASSFGHHQSTKTQSFSNIYHEDELEKDCI